MISLWFVWYSKDILSLETERSQTDSNWVLTSMRIIIKVIIFSERHNNTISIMDISILVDWTAQSTLFHNKFGQKLDNYYYC